MENNMYYYCIGIPSFELKKLLHNNTEEVKFPNTEVLPFIARIREGKQDGFKLSGLEICSIVANKFNVPKTNVTLFVDVNRHMHPERKEIICGALCKIPHVIP